MKLHKRLSASGATALDEIEPISVWLALYPESSQFRTR